MAGRYGKGFYEYMDWGSWKTKRKVSPAALNYPKTKILKMLKDNYVPDVVKVTKTKMKKPPKKAIGMDLDWDEWDDFFRDLAK